MTRFSVCSGKGNDGRSGATRAKLLDFGLAKLAAHGERPALESQTHLPTQAPPVEALRAYDVSSDGLRFYATRQTARSAPPVVTHINLILNWFEELQAKVPVRR